MMLVDYCFYLFYFNSAFGMAIQTLLVSSLRLALTVLTLVCLEFRHKFEFGFH